MKIHRHLPLRFHYQQPIKRRESPRRINMTVCVAAICNNNQIIGAADRMLTAGINQDIEYEPPQSKIFQVRDSIFCMYAGTAETFTPVFNRVFKDVTLPAVKNDSPPKQWSVQEIAELHAKYYRELQRQRAEETILVPRGLTFDTFIKNQSKMASDIIGNLDNELIQFHLPTVQAIYGGVGSAGLELYIVENETVICETMLGMAVIGGGMNHAASELMFANHARWKPVPDTILMVYSAKKRAEVAPGVGKATDMVWSGPRPQVFSILYDGVKDTTGLGLRDKLDAVFTWRETQYHKIAQRALTKFSCDYEQLRIEAQKLATKSQQAPATSSISPPPPSSQYLTSATPTVPPPAPSRPSDRRSAPTSPQPGSSSG
ncbi:MAG: hypothetical protein WA117_25145 [Verrucomicrobiia bacterium]